MPHSCACMAQNDGPAPITPALPTNSNPTSSYDFTHNVSTPPCASLSLDKSRTMAAKVVLHHPSELPQAEWLEGSLYLEADVRICCCPLPRFGFDRPRTMLGQHCPHPPARATVFNMSLSANIKDVVENTNPCNDEYLNRAFRVSSFRFHFNLTSPQRHGSHQNRPLWRVGEPNHC